MKAVRLLCTVVVALVLVGCNKNKSSNTQGIQGLSVPNLGGYTVIATMKDNSENNLPKVVTWYDKPELICIESGNDKPYGNQFAAFTCWKLNEAPVIFQKLVSGWKLGLPSYGEHRDWPPQQ